MSNNCYCCKLKFAYNCDTETNKTHFSNEVWSPLVFGAKASGPQAALRAWANRRQFIAPEVTEKIAPTRLEGINLRRIFRFPTERYAEQILPSQTLPKILANA